MKFTGAIILTTLLTVFNFSYAQTIRERARGAAVEGVHTDRKAEDTSDNLKELLNAAVKVIKTGKIDITEDEESKLSIREKAKRVGIMAAIRDSEADGKNEGELVENDEDEDDKYIGVRSPPGQFKEAVDHPIFEAIMLGDNNKVKSFVKSGTDLTIRGTTANITPPMLAAALNDHKSLALMLKGEKELIFKMYPSINDPNLTSRNNNLLGWALKGLKYGNHCAKFLLGKGFMLNFKTGKEHNTALMDAAIAHDFTAVKFLIEEGAIIDVVNKEGKTVFDLVDVWIPDPSLGKILDIPGKDKIIDILKNHKKKNYVAIPESINGVMIEFASTIHNKVHPNVVKGLSSCLQKNYPGDNGKEITCDKVYISSLFDIDHGSTSNHYQNLAVDISRINGKKLMVYYPDDQDIKVITDCIQNKFENCPIRRENYGPCFKKKNGVTTDSVDGHKDHIHLSVTEKENAEAPRRNPASVPILPPLLSPLNDRW